MNAISRFVLCAVMPSAENGDLTPPAFLGDASGWSRAIDFARRIHAAGPFAANCLACPWIADADPGSVLKLEERSRRDRMVLAILDHELDAALFQLLGARIPVILMKGMELGRRFYPKRLLRPMTDVDVLVPRERFMDGLRALGRGGYRVSGPFPEGRIRVELSKEPGGPVVELHSRLQAGDSESCLAGIWHRSRDAQLKGLPGNVRVLSDEDNLVYLIRHGAVQHLLESPVWVNDLHYLIQGSSLAPGGNGDWDQVVWNLAEARALSAAFLVLNMLERDWGTPVPRAVLQGVEKKVGKLRKGYLSRRSSAAEWFSYEDRSLPSKVQARFFLRDRAVDALRYGMRVLSDLSEREPPAT